MAGSSKPRKRYRPQGVHLPQGRVDRLVLPAYAALTAFQFGQASGDNYADLAAVVNIFLVLSRRDASISPAAEGAAQALLDIAGRKWKAGKYGASGEELEAVRGLMRLVDGGYLLRQRDTVLISAITTAARELGHSLRV